MNFSPLNVCDTNGLPVTVTLVTPTLVTFYVYGWAATTAPRSRGDIAWIIRQMQIPGTV